MAKQKSGERFMRKRNFGIGILAAILMLTSCGQTGKETQVTGETGEAPEWANASAIYEVNIRQYTPEGTIDAFAEHLDEIKDMGIDIIWLMPVHPISETKRSGKLGSYYSITDYCEINPEFGTKEDFAELIELAHEKEMHVMMDWVANHTGWDCEWITEHPDWYTQENGEIISPKNMGWPDVADLNFDNKDMRKEMIDSMAYWVKEFDVDGFRCDYATGVPVDFWEEARTELDKIKPVYMLAEDGKTKALLNQAFDENYNWDLYDNMVAVANGSKTADRLRLYLGKNYPEGTYPLNFLDNHDKNSYEGTIVENFGTQGIPAFWTYLFTIPGQPLVYSSDEIGYDHAIAFMEKDTIAWDKGTADYRPLIKALSEVRKNHPALYAGTAGGEITEIETGSKSMVAFSRTKDDDTVVVLINLSKNELHLKGADFADYANATVLIHGQADGAPETESRKIDRSELQDQTFAPWEYYVLSLDK